MSDFYMHLFETKSMPRKSPLFLVDNQKDNIDTRTVKEKIVHDDLYSSLRIFLRFGRLIGVVPIGGLMEQTSENLNFRWRSFPAVSSIIIILILSVNVFVGIISCFRAQKKTASDLAFSSAMAMFYSTGLFLYTYFLLNADNFIQLFKKWRDLKELHFWDDKVDFQLFSYANKVAGFILTSAILENMLLFLLQSKLISFSKEEKLNTSFWEEYYKNSHGEWYQLYTEADGSPFLGVLLFASNKMALYSWNFTDILIILFSRALYYKFKKLNRIAEDKLIVGNVINHDPQEWKELTHDHTILCELLNEFEIFLTPLVFGCYASNIFFTCLQVKMGITPSGETSLAYALYTVWSFVHLIFRIFLVSVSAGRINDHAHATRFLLQMCPPEAYSLEVQRAEHRLGTSVIGLTGLHCFVITKPFLLHIVGVVFTIEIVLLQTI